MRNKGMTLREVMSLVELLGGMDAVRQVLGDREFSSVKHGGLSMGQLLAVVNKLGGVNGVMRLL